MKRGRYERHASGSECGRFEGVFVAIALGELPQEWIDRYRHLFVLAQDGQQVRLEVRDWGIGFNPESVEEGHFGLEGIRQRMRLLGGRLTIESTPGSGTLVQVAVPILEKREE